MVVVRRVVGGEGGEREGEREVWAKKILVLLQLAPLCQSVLRSVSRECLQLGECKEGGGREEEGGGRWKM